MLSKTDIAIPEPSLFWNMSTAVNRVVAVPIFLVICLVTFGSDNTMIQAICVLFMTVDPVVGITTIMVVRYRGKQRKNKEDADINMNAQNELV